MTPGHRSRIDLRPADTERAVFFDGPVKFAGTGQPRMHNYSPGLVKPSLSARLPRDRFEDRENRGGQR